MQQIFPDTSARHQRLKERTSMNHEPEEAIWQRISKTLFGARKTTDEGRFTYSVMERVRRLQPAFQDLAWPRFLHWAMPALGLGIASLVLAARTPAPLRSPSMEIALFQLQTPDEDPLSPILEEFR